MRDPTPDAFGHARDAPAVRDARGARPVGAPGAAPGAPDPSDARTSSIRRAKRDALHDGLAHLRRRWRAYALLNGLVRVGIAVVFTSLLQLLVDRWLRLAVDQRAVLNAVLTVLWLWLVYRFLLRPLLAPLSDRAIAGVVDASRADLHDRYETAVQFAQGAVGPASENSPALIRAVLREAEEAARRERFAAVLNHRRAAHRAFELLLLVALPLLAFAVAPGLTRTWFSRNWLLADIPWPQRTRLEPQGFVDGRLRFPRGDELEIVASIVGEVPRSATIAWHTPSGRRGRDSMTNVGNTRFRAALGVLTEDVRFRLAGGDERTREFLVEAVEPPRVVRLATRVHPPAYTGLSPFVVEQQSFVELPAGSDVELEAWTNKPIAEARLTWGEGRTQPCELASSDHLRVRLADPQPGAYQFGLLDRDGWSDRNPVRVTLRVEPDRPPTVTLELTGVGDLITPAAHLTIDVSAEDAYGLASVGLVVRRGEDEPVERPLPEFRPGSRETRATVRLEAAQLGVTPGDRLALWAAAADVCPGTANASQSAAVALRVVSREDFLTELARREFALRQEFERLVASQRVVNDALQRLAQELPETGQAEVSQAQRLAALSRRQAQHARRCLAMSEQFAQVLAEMRTNRVGGASAERRIGEGIVAPLAELGAQAMPAAAGAIDELRSSSNAQQKQTALLRQDEILRLMRAVLAGMLKWEGYQELVQLLRELIEEQGELRSQTLRALDARVADILEPDPSPTPTSEP